MMIEVDELIKRFEFNAKLKKIIRIVGFVGITICVFWFGCLIYLVRLGTT